MKKFLLLSFIMIFCGFNSFAQDGNVFASNTHFLITQQEKPSEDIQLAGMYMEKAANHYKISRILFIAAALTPVIFRVTRSVDSDSSGLTPVLASSALGLTGLGFGFSGDLNLKKGGSILRRINLK